MEAYWSTRCWWRSFGLGFDLIFLKQIAILQFCKSRLYNSFLNGQGLMTSYIVVQIFSDGGRRYGPLYLFTKRHNKIFMMMRMKNENHSSIPRDSIAYNISFKCLWQGQANGSFTRTFTGSCFDNQTLMVRLSSSYSTFKMSIARI